MSNQADKLKRRSPALSNETPSGAKQPAAEDESDWGYQPKRSGMAGEAKLAFVMIVSLLGVLAFVVHRKFDDLKSKLATQSSVPETRSDGSRKEMAGSSSAKKPTNKSDEEIQSDPVFDRVAQLDPGTSRQAVAEGRSGFAPPPTLAINRADDSARTSSGLRPIQPATLQTVQTDSAIALEEKPFPEQALADAGDGPEAPFFQQPAELPSQSEQPLQGAAAEPEGAMDLFAPVEETPEHSESASSAGVSSEDRLTDADPFPPSQGQEAASGSLFSPEPPSADSNPVADPFLSSSTNSPPVQAEPDHLFESPSEPAASEAGPFSMPSEPKQSSLAEEGSLSDSPSGLFLAPEPKSGTTPARGLSAPGSSAEPNGLFSGVDVSDPVRTNVSSDDLKSADPFPSDSVSPKQDSASLLTDPITTSSARGTSSAGRGTLSAQDSTGESSGLFGEDPTPTPRPAEPTMAAPFQQTEEGPDRRSLGQTFDQGAISNEGESFHRSGEPDRGIPALAPELRPQSDRFAGDFAAVDPEYRRAEEPSSSVAEPFSSPHRPTRAPDRVHTVRPNDNYWAISKAHYGTIRYFAALAEYNSERIPDPRKMRPGMKVLIPPTEVLESRYPKMFRGMRSSGSAGRRDAVGGQLSEVVGFFVSREGNPMYRVGKGDTLSSISQAHLGRASRAHEIYQLNRDRLTTPDKLKLGMVLRLPRDASQIALSPDAAAIR